MNPSGDGIQETARVESSLPNDHFIHSAQSKPLLRNWQSKGCNNHSPNDFVLPLFIIPEDDIEEPIASMPGVFRYGSTKAITALKPLIEEYGLKSVLLFPVMRFKGLDKAINQDYNPVIKFSSLLKSLFPDLLVIADVCLCAFTDDGHCCVFDENGKMDNSKSLEYLASLSLAYAKAGVDMVAPSDMMDARVHAIRKCLDLNGYNDVSIMGYSAKFSSCFYGPFRDAAGSKPKFGDRKTYQLPPASSGLAMKAVARDIREGADIVMIKPAMVYLDIVRRIASAFEATPIAVYHVSGEYAMLHHAATAGAFDLETAVMETIDSFKRAGASIIITYYTPMILKLLKLN